MADYKILLCDALTDSKLAEIPVTSMAFSEVLNEPGTASITFPLNVDKRQPSPIPNRLNFPGVVGNYVVTPHDQSFNITQQIEIVCRVSQNWAALPPVAQGLVCKFDGPTGFGRSFFLRRRADNGSLDWGIGSTSIAFGTVPPEVQALGNATIWLRVRYNGNTGSGRSTEFAWALDQEDEPTTWNFSETVTQVTPLSIPTGTFPLVLGSDATSTRAMTGSMQRAVVRDGFGGPVVADWRVSDHVAGALSAEDRTGKLWTVTGSQMAFVFPFDQSSAAVSTFPKIEPLRQSVWIERDGLPVWAGIVWTAQMDVASNNATINAAGFWSLVRMRRIAKTLIYNNTEQVQIAKLILDHLQQQPGGDMLIDTTGLPDTAFLRTRVYYDYERKNAGEAIEQLSAVSKSFDFAVRPVLEDGVPKRRFMARYPNTGRSTAIVLDAGSNVELLSAVVDGTNIVTSVHARGEGDGPDALLATYTNTTMLGKYPLTEDLITHSDVSRLNTLKTHADVRLSRGQSPMVFPTVVIHGGSEPVLGSYEVGDRVRLRVKYGLLDIDGTFRITQWNATVQPDQGETVSLQLAPLEVFSDV
jgi:hypothetical protein